MPKRDSLTVACNLHGRLEVVGGPGTDSHTVTHNSQISPNGGWSGWSNIDGPYASGVNKSAIRSLVIGQNRDGRLEVFGAHGGVMHAWQAQSSDDTHWSDWASIPYRSNALNQLAVAAYFRLPQRSPSGGPGQNQDGRLEVFATDASGSLVHIWQTSPGGAWSQWAFLGSGYAITTFVAGQNADGRLEVFGIDGNGTVLHMWQQPGAWSDWAFLGSGYQMNDLCVGQNSDGRLEVFAVDGHGSLFHIWQTSPNNGWSDNWVPLGAGYQIATLAVGQNQDGRLEVFGVDRHGTLLHLWQTAPGGGWSDWTSLGSGYSIYSIAIGQNADGRLEVFALDSHRTSLHLWQQPGGGWSDWAVL